VNDHDISLGAMRDKVREAVSWAHDGEYLEAISVFE
jgi:hypothetical protein